MENKLRSTIDSVYFGKTREVVAHLRASDGVLAVERRGPSAQTGAIADVLKRQSLGGGVALPGMGAGGPLGLAFDPKAALAGLRSTKKAAAAPPAEGSGGGAAE